MDPRRSRPHSSTNCQPDIVVFKSAMEDNYTGRVRDDVTTLLDTSLNPESSYHTPHPLTPVERSARRVTGGRLQNRNGQDARGSRQWDNNTGLNQIQRADYQAKKVCDEQGLIRNEGLGNPRLSKETTADLDQDDSFFLDTHSQPPALRDTSTNLVTGYLGAQFDLGDSQDFPHQYGYQHPSIALSDPDEQTIRPVADDRYCLMLGDNSITTTSLVEQVHEILHDLHEEWMEKLKSTPELYLRCMPLSTCRLLETGTSALLQCFSGNLPRSFDDLFALMHVAFAFSKVINTDVDPYYWDVFYSDLRDWQHTVSDPEELSLFGKVWNRLLCPPSSNNHSFVNPPRDKLYETLMEGLVIKGCANLLDVFGHTTMPQKRSLPPADDHLLVTHILEKDVMQPLTERPAIREYWEQIIDAQSKFRRGLIRDPHELELVLISKNTTSNTSFHVHSRYMKEVTSQFDRTMGAPDWRYRCYTTYLRMFLDQARELPVSPPSKVDNCSSVLISDSSVSTHAATPASSTSYSSYNRSLHHNRPTISPYTPSPTRVVYTAPSDVSRPTSSSLTSSTYDSLKTISSPATSIDLLSTTSGPTTPTPSMAGSESGSGVTVCELCPDGRFKGNPSSQRRSLNRHKKAKHNNKERLKCPRCVETFAPGRPDNLSRHMKTFGHY